jgi:hypothetical protein
MIYDLICIALENPSGRIHGLMRPPPLSSKCVVPHCFDARSIKLAASSDGAEKNGE